jgi:phenol 2-monooxygenase
MVHSESHGSLMNIPRENKLTRLYIQLNEVKPDASGRADRSKITPEIIIEAAQRIIAPYKLEYKYCDWWTAYQIGQRVGKTFSKHNRVFLAGDAVHTHSPKAGQGMNVGMQDAYNLGWKVGLCARNVCSRSILPTYQSERRRVAQDLIDFDHKFSRLFSGRPAKDIMDEAGVSMEEFKKTFLMGALFTAGLSLKYGKSVIVAKEGDAQEQGDGSTISGAGEGVIGKQHLAVNIKLGMRFPSYQVLNQLDSRPWHFQEWMKSDGRFRILLFAGDYRKQLQKDRVKDFCDALQKPNSFLMRVTGSRRRIDSVIEILTCHSAPRKEVEFFDFPKLLRPFDENEGWDYNKIFVDDESYHEGHGQAYKNYGIDSERGCIVLLRPDQYVAYVGEIEDVHELDIYFKGVLKDASDQIAPAPKSIGRQLPPGFIAKFERVSKL